MSRMRYHGCTGCIPLIIHLKMALKRALFYTFSMYCGWTSCIFVKKPKCQPDKCFHMIKKPKIVLFLLHADESKKV